MYVKLNVVKSGQWEVSIDSKTSIATITRNRNGKCSAKITANRALSRDEMHCITDNMAMIEDGVILAA